MEEKHDAKKVRELANELTKRLTDEGKIIEGGWVGFEAAVVQPDAPQPQRNDMRMAFFAGATHLFTSVMSVLDSDREPTERDLKRMSLIWAELEAFDKVIRAQAAAKQHGGPAGTA